MEEEKLVNLMEIEDLEEFKDAIINILSWLDEYDEYLEEDYGNRYKKSLNFLNKLYYDIDYSIEDLKEEIE